MSDAARRPNRSAELLRSAREAKGLSIGEAAALVGCSRSTVARWERDGFTDGTPVSSVASAALAYGIGAAELLAAVGEASAS